MAPGPPDESDFLNPADEDGAERSRPVRPWLVVVAIISVVALAVASVGTFWPRSGGGGGAGAPSPVAAVDVVGRPLPDLPFLTFEGSPRSLGELRGPHVVNFFAYWCAPCREEMPDFQQVHELYGEAVGFLGLDYVDDPANGLKMVAETGITYPVGRDPDGSVLEGLGGVAMPTTVFVDARGIVTSVHSGRLDAATLQRIISDELGAGAGAAG